MKIVSSVSIVTCLVLGAMIGTANAGDAAAGKAKSESCVGCHGMNGKSNNPNYPNLYQQKKNYLIKAIKAYRDGQRKDPMMSSFVTGLSDADVEDLAEFYSTAGKK